MLCSLLRAGTAHEAEGLWRTALEGLWSSAKSSESLWQAGAMSLKTATDSAAHLVMSTTGHQVAKAAIYTLAWSNHSPGRNDRLEDKIL